MNQVLRHRMVEEQIRSRGITNADVLKVMENVPRHLFIPEEYQAQAYEDTPLPIGQDQTISQPYIVGLMSSLLELTGNETILEIGTGSGYQTAVLAQLAATIYTVEIIPDIGDHARRTLRQLGYRNVHLRIGDGYQGWSEEAPFDAIVVTAAPICTPLPLIEQLKVGGKLTVPVGRYDQDLCVIVKNEEGYDTRNILPVRFVPMTGEAQLRGEK